MSRFVSDCSRCCGLCCIVPAYLKEQGFPTSKPADKPCRHLQHGDCSIHAQRAALTDQSALRRETLALIRRLMEGGKPEGRR